MGPVGKTALCVCFSTSREHRRYFYVNDQSSASQWEFPAVKEEEGDAKPSAVCQENAGPPPPEASSGLVGRSVKQPILEVQNKERWLCECKQYLTKFTLSVQCGITG